MCVWANWMISVRCFEAPDPKEKSKKNSQRQRPRRPLPQRRWEEKKDDSPGRATVWIPKDVQRKLRLLCLWLESEGLKDAPTIGELISEAVENLIETKYPKAKALLKRLLVTEGQNQSEWVQRRTKLTDQQVPLSVSASASALTLRQGTIGTNHRL